MSEPVSRPSRWWPWLLVGGIVLAVVALVIIAGPTLWSVFSDPQAFRDWLRGFGIWSPAVFVLIQMVQVIVFVLPGEVTQIAGGWLFGFGLGSFLSVLGITLGSAIAFGLTRWLGVRFVHRIAGPQTVEKFDHLMSSPQFIGSLFLLFLIPGIPKDVLCYVAGLSRLKFMPYLVVSTLARLPGILGSSLMGKALFHGDWPLLVAVAAVAALLFGLGWWFREPIFRLVERFTVKPNPKKDNAP